VEDFNAPHPSRIGVSVGEDLADQVLSLTFRILAVEQALKNWDTAETDSYENEDELVDALNTAIHGTPIKGGFPTVREVVALRRLKQKVAAILLAVDTEAISYQELVDGLTDGYVKYEQAIKEDKLAPTPIKE
jgi:hypothetical protein